MHEMLKAVRTTSTMRSRAIVCPYCGHKMFTVYEGSTGYIQTKCSKCKKISPINLVSMRRCAVPEDTSNPIRMADQT